MKPRTVRRILVALDASPQSDVALEEAASLAARLEAELTGIFVVDSELMRLSALPVAHETGLTSARRRPISPESMARALRLQADRTRVALEKTARQHSLQSSFRLSKGNVVAELLNAAGQADLLTMGIMGHMDITGRRLGSTARGVRAGLSCSLLLLANSLRRGRSVVVVYSGSPDSIKALKLAVELGEHLNAELIVLLCAEGEALKPLRAAAEERLADAGIPFVFEHVAADRFDELRLLIQRHEGSLLVIGQDCELVTDHEDELDNLACPVLLARDGQDEVEPGGG